MFCRKFGNKFGNKFEIKAKALLPLLLVPATAMGATTYDRARVVDVEPLYETVSYDVPVEQCRQERVRYSKPRQQHASATGPLLGALIGGAIGNAVGHEKRNKQVGTVVGALLGGSIGADISRRNHSQHGSTVRYGTEQICNVMHEVREEERLAGYNVTYVYAGETYTTRMRRDPGDSIRVRVSVRPVD